MKLIKINARDINIAVMLFIFLVLFLMPAIFTRVDGHIEWQSVVKIWQDRILLLPLFAINHWILIPWLVLKKRYILYFLSVFMIVALITVSYSFYDNSPKKIDQPLPPAQREMRLDNPGREPGQVGPVNPEPVPPYADLLLFSLLIVSVDTGLSFTSYWKRSEEEKVRLEKKNIEAELGMLRNQVSPHFFMNTLNNIYSLIDGDKERSKQAVMKLSKLMRYLLYENQNGMVAVSREFDFVRSYIDLMKLRFVDDIGINLEVPEEYENVEIPVLLFISYLENAFKYGASYEQKSFIDASFSFDNGYLIFRCSNSRNVFSDPGPGGGIGLRNSRQRLDLLYGNRYSLDVDEKDDTFTVTLKIPVS